MENNIGRQIRIHRLHCSMTQEKLAELLCVTPQAVSKCENGASYPDITLLPELSAALGIKIDELFETSHRVLELTGHSWMEFCQSFCKNDSHINFFFRKINSNK